MLRVSVGATMGQRGERWAQTLDAGPVPDPGRTRYRLGQWVWRRAVILKIQGFFHVFSPNFSAQNGRTDRFRDEDVPKFRIDVLAGSLVFRLDTRTQRRPSFVRCK